MPAATDDELMNRIARQDADAFDTLFARHGPDVRQRLAAMVRDDAAADDLLQEVFLRLWTHAEQWAGRGSVGAWLGRIATNLALNHLRSLRQRRQQPLTAQPGQPFEDDDAHVPAWMIDASAIAPADAAERGELLERFGRLVQFLPPGKREVLRLLHQEGMNLRQAAEELGIPLGTAKSRLHYARAMLAREWQSLIEEPGEP